jgi:hypothetical protein
MKAKARITVILNGDGRIVAAQLPAHERVAPEKGAGKSQLAPKPGHRIVTVEVPREVLQLSGADLGRFFSGVHVGHNGDIHLPKVEVTKHSDHAKSR